MDYVDSTIFTKKAINVANSDLIRAHQLGAGRLGHHENGRTSREEQGRAGEPGLTQGLPCPHPRGRVPVPLAELQPAPCPALPGGAGGMERDEADGCPLRMKYLRFLSV